MKTSDPIFEETQYFRQIWLWILIIPAMLLACIVPWVVPSKTEPVFPAIISTFICLAVLLLFYWLHLKTRITDEGIIFSFPPFLFREKRIPFSDINKLEVIKYHPIRDFGGWGIKWGLKGRAYNVSGNMGLMIELKNGKHLLLGTNKADDLRRVIEKIHLS